MQIAVYNLTTPIEAVLPIRRKLVSSFTPTPRSAQCLTDGRSRVMTADCYYSSGINRTITSLCDGQRAVVGYECPVVPRCVYWDPSLHTWSDKGCTTASLAWTGGVVTGVRCKCNHLTTFSAVPDVLSHALVTMSSPMGPSRASESSHSWALLIILSSIYLSLIVALVVLRLRRTQESLSYLR
jgi:hypothetical protein